MTQGMTEQSGKAFPERYPPLAWVGQGGQAMLWRTRDHKRIALFPLLMKCLHPHLAIRKEAREAFCHEAGLFAQGMGIFLPRFYDCELEVDRPFLVREYYPGTSFSRLQPNASRSICLSWLQDIAYALTGLHDHGWVHGDVKPANIICSLSGMARLVDFGSARKRLDRSDDAAPWCGWQHSLWASSAYKPQPDSAGQAALSDTRCDFFALAVMIHEVFVGRHPFKGGREPEVHTPAGIHQTLWRRVLAALALDPAVRRYDALWLTGAKDRRYRLVMGGSI